MKVHEKLYAVQQQLKAPKGQRNDFGKYNYRSAEDIIEAVKPLCAKYKAVLVLNDEIQMVGDRYYVEATATIWDLEKEERYLYATDYAREEESRKGRSSDQLT